jgi:hypothetical protein
MRTELSGQGQLNVHQKQCFLISISISELLVSMWGNKIFMIVPQNCGDLINTYYALNNSQVIVNKWHDAL